MRECHSFATAAGLHSWHDCAAAPISRYREANKLKCVIQMTHLKLAGMSEGLSVAAIPPFRAERNMPISCKLSNTDSNAASAWIEVPPDEADPGNTFPIVGETKGPCKRKSPMDFPPFSSSGSSALRLLGSGEALEACQAERGTHRFSTSISLASRRCAVAVLSRCC